MDLQQWLEVAVEAAYCAGDIIVKTSTDCDGIGKDVKTKSNEGDFVTIADRSSQHVICSIFSSRFPHLTVLGEEANCGDCLASKSPEVRSPILGTLAPPATQLPDSPTWTQIHTKVESRELYTKSMSLARAAMQEYAEGGKAAGETMYHKIPFVPCNVELPVDDCMVFVDPLDGTFNYVRDCFYAVGVSIGLCYKGEAIAGVLFYPFFSKELLSRYNFPMNTFVYTSAGRTLHPYQSSIDELVASNAPMDLLYGARYGDYCNSNLLAHTQTLFTNRLRDLSESTPFSTHYFQVQNMPIRTLEPLIEWVNSVTDETHIQIREKDGLQTFYGALCKFREMLLGIGGCIGVIYIDGFLRPWDICAFMGIAHTLQLDVYTKRLAPLTLLQSTDSARQPCTIQKGHIFQPTCLGNIPFLVVTHKDSISSYQLAKIALEIAPSLPQKAANT